MSLSRVRAWRGRGGACRGRSAARPRENEAKRRRGALRCAVAGADAPPPASCARVPQQGVGKSSLVTAVATKSFPDGDVPETLPLTVLDADELPDHVPVHIVDCGAAAEREALRGEVRMRGQSVMVGFWERRGGCDAVLGRPPLFRGPDSSQATGSPAWRTKAMRPLSVSSAPPFSCSCSHALVALSHRCAVPM